MRSAVLYLFALACMLVGPGPLYAQTAASGEQDGILADLHADAAEATLEWRFLRRPPAPVRSIEATLNGRPVGTPNGYEPFPGAGQSLLVSLLVDVGDPARAAAIGEAEDAVAALSHDLPPGVQVRVATYDTDLHPFEPAAGSGTASLRDAAPPSDKASDLSAALAAAIETAAALPATRRAVLVYSDGHNAGAGPLGEIENLARARQVCVYFVLTPSMRLADVAALTHLAEATHGKVFGDQEPVRPEIVDFLMSGARVRFPLDTARRFVWERRSVVRATIDYGDRRLRLATRVDLPIAGPAETVSFAWRLGPTMPVLVGAAAGGLLVAGVGLARRARRRRPAPRSN